MMRKLFTLGLMTLFLMGMGEVVGQVTIAKQGFETSGETWSITTGAGNISTNAGSGDTPASQRIRTGSRSWQVSSGNVTLDLASVDVSSYSSITARIRFSSTSATTGNGADAGDNVRIFLALNGGAFPGTADITIAGNNNARWGYNATLTASTTAGTPASVSAPQTGTSTNNYSSVSITIPDGTSSVSLRLIALNNSADEIWNIDDIELTGTLNSTGTTTLTAGAGAEPATISSLTNTQGAAALNFDIAIQDDGATAGADVLATIVTQMVFTQGTGNDVSNWTTIIDGAELNDGTNTMTGTVGATSITFASIDAALGTVADNATKTYTLKVWLKTDFGAEKLTADGKNLVFRIQQSNITVDGTGSAFASGQDQNSGASNNAIDVTATTLAFVQNATTTGRSASMSPAPTVSANDANGNRDRDYATAISITSTGTLTGSPVSAAPATGLATFSSLVHTVSQTGRQLTAASGVLSDATSGTFDVIDVSSTSDFFRSNGTGNWSSAATWQSSPNGIDWITATLAPTSASSGITILSGNTVTVTSSVTVDQVVVESGGTLEIASGVAATLANGSGIDLDVSGTVLNQGNVTWTGTMTIQSAGTYVHNTTSSSGSALDKTTMNSGSIWIYRGNSLLTPSAAFSGRTYSNLSVESTSGSFPLTMSGSSVLTVNGDFTVESGVTLNNTMTGANVFAGNFTNNGTVSNGTGTQIYTFTGSGTTIGGSSATNFESLIINSGSEISLGQGSTAGNLTLTSGKLILGNNNLTVSGSISGGSSSSYIVTDGTGVLQMSVGAGVTRAFPIGASVTSYDPASVMPASATTIGARVQVGFSIAPPNPSNAVDKEWDITSSAPSSTVVSFTPSDPIATTSPVIGHYVSGDWEELIATRSGDTWTCTTTSFSPFGVGEASAFPVTLESFTAKADNNQTRLTWATATEQNNSHFLIQRSVDGGRKFETIGQVAGRGDSNERVDYTYVDEKPATGTNYYRLHQFDYDGTNEFFGPVSVVFAGKGDAVRVWPTLAENELTIETATDSDAAVLLSVYDLNGRLMLEQIASDKALQTTMSVAHLPAGAYFIRWQQGSAGGQVRFVKQ